MNVIKVGAFAFLAIAIIKSVGKSIKNNLFFRNIKVTNSNLSNGVWNLGLTLNISNGNNLALPLDSFTGDLLVYGRDVADIIITSPVTIPSGGNVEIPINASIVLSELGLEALSIIQNGAIPGDIVVKGTLVSKGIPITIEQRIV